MNEAELEAALHKAFAAAAFYREALSQIKELTKSSTADMFSIRRSCSDALDATDVGAQFLQILQQLNIENQAFREVFGKTSESVESVH